MGSVSCVCFLPSAHGLGEGVRREKGTGKSSGLTNVARDTRIQPAEHDIAVGELARLALLDDKLARVADGRRLLPLHGVLVLLAGGPRRGADGVELDVRVVLEEEDEALAHGPRAAEDACGS